MPHRRQFISIVIYDCEDAVAGHKLWINNHDFAGSQGIYKMSTSLDGNQVRLKKDNIEFTLAVYDTKAGNRSAGWVDMLTRIFIASCMTFGIMGFGLAYKYRTLSDIPITFGVRGP